ncbi:MAG: hypothetical protein NZ902_06445 [Acidilobaceae archaeon]|nr:hypothetical protein [Acidilobaceae archaeon]
MEEIFKTLSELGLPKKVVWFDAHLMAAEGLISACRRLGKDEFRKLCNELVDAVVKYVESG